MYIHGTVSFPTSVIPYPFVRRCVYNMFFLNIPNTMSFLLFNKRFRLLMVGASWVGDRMSIDNISCRMDFTPVMTLI